LEAISSDSDSVALKVLLALRSKFGDSLEGDWDRLLATAADREWAVETDSHTHAETIRSSNFSLLFYLLSRLAVITRRYADGGL